MIYMRLLYQFWSLLYYSNHVCFFMADVNTLIYSICYSLFLQILMT